MQESFLEGLMMRRMLQLLLALSYPGLLSISIPMYVFSIDTGSTAGELLNILIVLMLPVGIVYCIVGWKLSARQTTVTDFQDLNEYLFTFIGLLLITLGAVLSPQMFASIF